MYTFGSDFPPKFSFQKVKNYFPVVPYRAVNKFAVKVRSLVPDLARNKENEKCLESLLVSRILSFRRKSFFFLGDCNSAVVVAKTAANIFPVPSVP